MITVVVVDDHAVVRSGLRLLLDANEDIEVVGEAGNAKDAIFRARALKPDVMLLDVVMPGSSGIDALPEAPQGVTRNEGARSLDAGRSKLRPRGFRCRRKWLCPQGGGR